MQHIVSIGGGLASTMELPRQVLALAPKADCRFIMARLPNEDPDVWRLCEAVSAELGITVEYIGLNLTPWDIFHQERMIGNTRIDPCSRRLKREVLTAWMVAHCDPADTTLYVGLTADEVDRWMSVEMNWRRKGWTVAAPLLTRPTATRPALMDACQARYGFVPRLYRWGFSHNNCGGACVKAGQAEWARLLWHLPDVFAWWEGQETAFRAEHGKDVSILRDRRGGATHPLPLSVFRAQMETRWGPMRFAGDPDVTGLDPTPGCAWCEAA